MASGLEPHPLIVGLATRLVGGGNDLKTALAAAKAPKNQEAVTNAFAAEAQVPELALFSGFLGGTIERDKKKWRLLYLDPKALTWLLVEDDKIIWYENVEDRSAPSKRRDVIWLRKDTTIGQGVGPESAEARFLTGTFTSAGDLHASLTDASTPPPDTGILCAPTPDCYCSPYRTR
jgi:hypothetical protein